MWCAPFSDRSTESGDIEGERAEKVRTDAVYAVFRNEKDRPANQRAGAQPYIACRNSKKCLANRIRPIRGQDF